MTKITKADIQIRYELTCSQGFIGSYDNLNDLNQYIETMRELDPKRYQRPRVRMIVTTTTEFINWKPGLKSVRIKL